MKNRPRQSKTNEKAHRIEVGLSNILSSYVLAGTVQITNLIDCDNSISRVSNATGGE